MQSTPSGPFLPRQSSDSTGGSTGGDSTGDVFLHLIANPFSSQLAGEAALAALLTSLLLASAIALLFCFLRPYNSNVYAPRAKHADSKHAPPPVNSGLFGWIPPLLRTKEADLVEKVGVDAAVFIRVCHMLRNIFLLLSLIGCGILIPINLIAFHQNGSYSGYSKRQSTTTSDPDYTYQPSSSSWSGVFLQMTPLYMYGSPRFWAYVVVAYLFDAVILFFLWTNYKAILKLRRSYFNSPEYQRSLHSRTLLVSDIPQELRADDGIVKITEEVKSSAVAPRAAVARNVRDLPELVEEHETAVKELEEHLAKYLRNPARLPAKRPVCEVSKNDKNYTKGQQVDAIDYLTHRIKELEAHIKEVRESVDKRNALCYGFASYGSIAGAHEVAYAARKGGPHGTMIHVSPKPNHLVWKNLQLTKSERKRRNTTNILWITLLTLVWVVPNVLIAVFLSNLSHLGLLWPAFQASLYRHQIWWAIVQGVAAPAITTLFYLFLPNIFRKLCMKAGDMSKTSRERHVMRALYSFFTFNNLFVFSLFSAVWGWGVVIVNASSSNQDVWQAFEDSHPLRSIVYALCTVSPYWISWLLQRNLGAAVDLSQLIPLVWNAFRKRYRSPTPRELIQLSAPQPFEYASYFNLFLFYATVAMCFATIQPLVLLVTAAYFSIESFFKKYLILYVFITKYESGGMFWRSVYNRMLFLTVLSNLVVALLIVAVGDPSANWGMLVALIPPLGSIAAFKWYCMRTYDVQFHYYQMGPSMKDAEMLAGTDRKQGKHDRVGVRFGNPVLYRPLITPMVAAKSRHLLKEIYGGRTSMDDDLTGVAGYSDVYMDGMDTRNPGKTAGGQAPFELVDENQMDFEYYKTRPEFRGEAGGDGELYGRAQDYVRPGTPSSSSIMTGFTRRDTMESPTSGTYSRPDSRLSMADPRSRSQSRGSEPNKTGVHVYTPGDGVEYPRGYHQTPSALREQSPTGSDYGARVAQGQWRDSRENLVSTAAGMGRSSPPILPNPVRGGYEQIRLGTGVGMGMGVNTPDSDHGQDDTSYDYFRRGRQR